MGATYTRQSSYTDGDVITAAHTNDEFNQLLAAFAASTGHTHDGTTAEGGATNHGTVFRMTPAGVLTTLVQFTGIEGDNLGSAGTAALVQGSDGNFYGTTEFGGANDRGTEFKITPEGV